MDRSVEGIVLRRARESDLGAIVWMLADDALGREREQHQDPLPEGYVAAFRVIDGDPRNELVVADLHGRVIGTSQLTFLPYLTYRGGTRAQIEAVRVDRLYRGRGVGQALFGWAIERARQQGCHMVQLTTNAQRGDAQRFYERLGFKATHVGMKLDLTGDESQ
ncbi:MAG: GNAT family N-acetyltransferase [Herpetosiphon sp.]